MKGIIRSREKCADCGGKYVPGFIGRDPELLCTCGKRPRKYYIYLYYKGDHKIVQDHINNQLESYKQANRLLERIRSEIDQNTFDVTEYKQKTKKQFDTRLLIRKWYKGKIKKGLAPTTLKDYRGYIRRYFSPSAQKQKIEDCREIRTFHITNFFDSLPNSISLKTKKNILVALKNFTDWLSVQGILDKAIILTYPEFEVPEPKKIWSKKSIALSVLPFVPEHDRAIISFMLHHPLRSGEVCALKVKDINIEEGYIHVHRAISLGKERHRKNKKGYLCALSEKFDSSSLRRKFPDNYLFLNAIGNRYNSNALRKIWERACRHAQVEYIPLKYSGRTTIATEAINRGATTAQVAAALGDSEEVVRKHYAHLNVSSTRRVIDGN